MLIDTTHRRWGFVTIALALLSLTGYVVLRRLNDGQWSGGSTAGLWFGIGGTALMLFAGSLSFLRKVPSWWWLGSRKAWLRGHIWLGLLSGLLILFHSGCRWGGALETALWLVLIAILATGVLGLVFQWALPHLITMRVIREAPYEQIPHLVLELRRRADKLVEKIWETDVSSSQGLTAGSQLGLGARVQLQQFFEKEVRPYLDPVRERGLLLANPLQAEVAFKRLRALPGLADMQEQLDVLASLCEERRQLARQEQLHAWLHAWLMLHIPLSAALLVLGVAHIVGSLYY